MPKLKAGTILPTPAEDAAITAAAMADPDAMPFTDAQWAQVKPLVKHQFASVWDALEDTPEEAASMKASSALRMLAEGHAPRHVSHDEAVVEMLKADPDFAKEYLAAAQEAAELPGGQDALLTALRHIAEAQG